ncbi:MAG TPA: ATP synthase F1 subunit delta [Gemmataceae bacterium]|nr:ATP synthase F1 subunit delta [Gemmataceae bacterium]
MNEIDPARPQTVFDDATQHVAHVYGAALLNSAQKVGQAADIVEDLTALVNEVFPRDRYLEAFLTSRAVGRERKAQVLRTAFQGRASDLFLNFLLVLNDHDRLEALRAIAAAMREMYEDRQGLMRLRVRSAVPLADDQRERLTQELRTKFGRNPLLDASVDPDLLGGLTVQVGDVLYDASIRTRLEQIRNHLIESSSHAIQSQRDRFSS